MNRKTEQQLVLRGFSSLGQDGVSGELTTRHVNGRKCGIVKFKVTDEDFKRIEGEFPTAIDYVISQEQSQKSRTTAIVHTVHMARDTYARLVFRKNGKDFDHRPKYGVHTTDGFVIFPSMDRFILTSEQKRLKQQRSAKKSRKKRKRMSEAMESDRKVQRLRLQVENRRNDGIFNMVSQRSSERRHEFGAVERMLSPSNIRPGGSAPSANQNVDESPDVESKTLMERRRDHVGEQDDCSTVKEVKVASPFKPRPHYDVEEAEHKPSDETDTNEDGSSTRRSINNSGKPLEAGDEEEDENQDCGSEGDMDASDEEDDDVSDATSTGSGTSVEIDTSAKIVEIDVSNATAAYSRICMILEKLLCTELRKKGINFQQKNGRPKDLQTLMEVAKKAGILDESDFITLVQFKSTRITQNHCGTTSGSRQNPKLRLSLDAISSPSKIQPAQIKLDLRDVVVVIEKLDRRQRIIVKRIDSAKNQINSAKKEKKLRKELAVKEQRVKTLEAQLTAALAARSEQRDDDDEEHSRFGGGGKQGSDDDDSDEELGGD